jgi:hypothetical protein
MALITPFRPALDRGVIDEEDGPVFGPNELVSTLGKKSSSSLGVHFRKLQPDDDIAYNGHVCLH